MAYMHAQIQIKPDQQQRVEAYYCGPIANTMPKDLYSVRLTVEHQHVILLYDDIQQVRELATRLSLAIDKLETSEAWRLADVPSH